MLTIIHRELRDFTHLLHEQYSKQICKLSMLFLSFVATFCESVAILLVYVWMFIVHYTNMHSSTSFSHSNGNILWLYYWSTLGMLVLWGGRFVDGFTARARACWLITMILEFVLDRMYKVKSAACQKFSTEQRSYYSAISWIMDGCLQNE